MAAAGEMQPRDSPTQAAIQISTSIGKQTIILPLLRESETLNRPNIMMQFGELTGDPELAVSPASINFGEAIFGATIGPRNISLSNIGGGKPHNRSI